MNKQIPQEFNYLNDYNIKKIINKYIKKYKNKKVAIYGAGKLSDFIFNNYDLSKLNIVAVTDKKFEHQKEETFHNIKCYRFSELNQIDIDAIIIFVKEAESILFPQYQQMCEMKIEKRTKLEWLLHKDFSYYLKRKIKSLFIKKGLKNDRYIFTFWEPKSKIPAYIKLCMKTWERYLADYQIIVLDYDNLDEWLGYKYFDGYLYNNFSLPQQAIAIRAALLNKYGGIWMDADTIITSDKAKDILKKKANMIMFNTHTGFIIANKGAKVIKLWLNEIKRKIFRKKLYNFSDIYKFMVEKEFIINVKFWNYLSNSIVDKLREKITDNSEFLSLDRLEYFATPENNYYKDRDSSVDANYIDFYFKNDFSKYVQENEKGIIMLHNSWTPGEYKNMPEDKFLEQDFTLAKILKENCN